jgi:uncharacterized damage-inducible protein DinB
MKRRDVVSLFRYMEWADSVIWNSVIDGEAARQDRAIMERLHHIHEVQRIYLQMWLDDPDRGRELATFADLGEVYAWARDYYRDLWAFVETLEDPALERSVVFPWAEELVKWFGEARSATVDETILQVVLHSAHHRGQLATIIRELGGTPPLVDLIGWVWMGKPEPAWQAVPTP